MGVYGFAAAAVRATLTARLRWWLGHRLNQVFPTRPLGTHAANLMCGFLVGGAVALLNTHPGLAPEGRRMVVTGFMGGLTGFSAFSAEVVGLFGRTDTSGRWARRAPSGSARLR
ncbi:MAG: CrcB family protein [Sterolibacteriaceae bacterium]|nr:CrcB family protein [Sterolibacteriaceae bacterium]MBK9084091.1 CrcB family protein [Sterolibacteriaceae bacterium]